MPNRVVVDGYKFKRMFIRRRQFMAIWITQWTCWRRHITPHYKKEKDVPHLLILFHQVDMRFSVIRGQTLMSEAQAGPEEDKYQLYKKEKVRSYSRWMKCLWRKTKLLIACCIEWKLDWKLHLLNSSTNGLYLTSAAKPQFHASTNSSTTSMRTAHCNSTSHCFIGLVQNYISFFTYLYVYPC